MNYAKIRNDYLAGLLTKDEATGRLFRQVPKATIARRLVELWRTVQRLRRQLEAIKE